MNEDAIRNEILGGDVLSIPQAAKLIPGSRTSNEHADPATVWRWVTIGTKTPDGRIVKLGAVRLGGRWVTSKGALERYIKALTSATELAPVVRSDRERQRAADAANARLAAAGA